MTVDRRIPDHVIEAARSRLPLSTVAQRFVALKRAGAGEWKGLCPFHAERTPSFTVNDPKNFFHCFGCGEHGNAISILTRLGGMTFAEAIRELLGGDPHAFSTAAPARRPAASEPRRDDGADRARARAMIEHAAPVAGTPAERYLRWRGIRGSLPSCLRFAEVPYWHTWKGEARPAALGVFPALLAAVEDEAGIAAVQMTYLNPERDGRGKLRLEDRDHAGHLLPSKKSRGALRRGAVRLAPPLRGWLGLAEGVETAAALWELFEFPCWAVLGHNRFSGRLRHGEVAGDASSVALPPGVGGVVIFADRTKDGRVDPMALEAAEALEARGYRVEVRPPAARWKDWNDELRARLGARVVGGAA